MCCILTAALFLDAGIEITDRIFGEILFDDDPKLLNTWLNLPLHPIQDDEPNGDRHWVEKSDSLKVSAAKGGRVTAMIVCPEPLAK